jgi:hypothetical protein
MSDLAPTADGRTRIAGKPASPKITMLVLWIAVVAARAAPAIKSGVFGAMSTDDAMRSVEVRGLVAAKTLEPVRFRLNQNRDARSSFDAVSSPEPVVRAKASVESVAVDATPAITDAASKMAVRRDMP